MGKIVKASINHECDRCLGIIRQGETYEYTLVKNPPELNPQGNDHYTICHFHHYDCLNEKPPVEIVQEIDLYNIARHGHSNNL
jgi:hypothetical protein